MASSVTAQPTLIEPVVTKRTAVVVGGLGVGAVLGFGGNFVGQGAAQSLLFSISSTGLILAAVLLVVQHASVGRGLTAAGFALFALGETRLVGLGPDVPGAEAAFAGGVLLYAPALLLIAMSTWAPRWVRIAGAASAVFFAAHSVAFLAGGEVDSTGPLVGVGYGLLTLTIIGWILTVLGSRGSRAQ